MPPGSVPFQMPQCPPSQCLRGIDLRRAFVRGRGDRYAMRARADDITEYTPIIEDIWERINSAELIIADMTKRNPNAFYELGLAHAIGKRAILISQSCIPFYLQSSGTIIYTADLRGYRKASDGLVKFVKAMYSLRKGDDRSAQVTLALGSLVASVH